MAFGYGQRAEGEGQRAEEGVSWLSLLSQFWLLLVQST